MTGRELSLRLGGALIARACRRLPEAVRDERAREWAAELAAIADDPEVSFRLRRQVRAVRFAAGQRRTVRRLNRQSGLWPRWFSVRTAIVLAGVAGVLAVATVALSSAADHAASDSSPVVAVVIWLAVLAAVAGAACTVLIAALILARATRSVRFRQRRPAGGSGQDAAGVRDGGIRPRLAAFGGLTWRRARTAQGAGITLVAAVACFTAAIAAGTGSESMVGPSPSAASNLLSVLGSLLDMAGLACLILLVVLVIAGITTRIRRLVRPAQGPPGAGDA